MAIYYHTENRNGERITVGSFRTTCTAPEGKLDPQPTGEDARTVSLLSAFTTKPPRTAARPAVAPPPAEETAKRIVRQDPTAVIDTSPEHLGRFDPRKKKSMKPPEAAPAPTPPKTAAAPEPTPAAPAVGESGLVEVAFDDDELGLDFDNSLL